MKLSIFNYIGLFIGFIASLQLKNNRMFLLEGKTDFDCMIRGLPCPALSIVLFLLIGFVIGGIKNSKYGERKKEGK